MEIKEFIKEVIGDITDAVIEINSEKCNSGVVVCPSRYSNRGEIYSITEDGKNGQKRRFQSKRSCFWKE